MHLPVAALLIVALAVLVGLVSATLLVLRRRGVSGEADPLHDATGAATHDEGFVAAGDERSDVTTVFARPGSDLTRGIRIPRQLLTATAQDGEDPDGLPEPPRIAFPERADMEIAREAAEAAAAWLLDLRSDRRERALVTRGPALAGGVVTSMLREARPDAAILSGYAVDAERLEAEQVWIVDALEGAEAFATPGRSGWSVQVALWQDGDLTGGVVVLPALHTLVSSDAMGSALVAQEMSGLDTVAVDPGGPMMLATARTAPPAAVVDLADRLDAELVSHDSVGYAILAVVAGEVDAYIQLDDRREWDSAAAVAIARSAGMHVSRLDGAPVVYNRPDPQLPDLLVCRPEVTERITATLREMLAEAAELAAADAPTQTLRLGPAALAAARKG